MTKNAIVPYFGPELKLTQMKQSGFRDAEPWGRWLLGKRATLSFNAAEEQLTELSFGMSLPYKNQNVTLSLNGARIFTALRPPDPAGRLASKFLITLNKGFNTLEITTNRSNLDGFDRPFAENDQSDISIGIDKLTLVPIQWQHKEIYGLRPSNFFSPRYISAGRQGLEILFKRESEALVDYSLLRRFKNQSFNFYLDGQHIYTLNAGLPGHLLIGHFSIPSTALPPSGLHTLRVSAQTPTRQQSNVDNSPIPITAKDGADVQFYLQKLELLSTETAPNSPAFRPGVILLTVLLIGLLGRLLFKPQ